MSHIQSITTEKADRIVDVNQQAIFNRQRNALVPAVDLPTEILTTIFEFACSPDGGEWIANLDLKTQKDNPGYRDGCPLSACAVTPLFIGAICSVWRSTAWAAPQLWNRVTLLYNDRTMETVAEMLDFWLSKSGALPLSVGLDDDDTDCCPTADTSAKVIGAIAAYAHRLHALNLYLPGPWEPALVRKVTSRAPLLTRLTIRVSNNADPYDTSIDLADVPQLREVSLSWIRIENVSLPWAQLESLELDKDSGYDDVSDLVETLLLCPRLRRLSIPLGGIDWEHPTSPLLTHTALEVLEVSGFYGTFHPDLFTLLELPALRSFALHMYKDFMARNWSTWLPPLLSHVAGTLETLHISNAVPMDENLLAVLRVVPRLRKLVMRSIYNDVLTQRALELMNSTNCDGLGGIGQCVVSNLETFEYEGKVDFTSHALVEFLVARWRGPNVDAPSTRLRSVTFKTAKEFRSYGWRGCIWYFRNAICRSARSCGFCDRIFSFE